jgi:starvation-inducible DNA-binding protein
MENQASLADKLNVLLSTYQIHYQNLRALHWNVKGANFFELHLKYEELYTRAQIIIDDLAERILTLDSIPLHKLQDYLIVSGIKENTTIFNGNEGIEYILSTQKTLIALEKEILKISSDLEDDGTNSMMSDLIREKEKTNWMFTAWLNKK